MVINGAWNGKKCAFSLKHTGLTFCLDRQVSTDVYGFDQCGRLWTAMQDGNSYRTGLDGKIIARWMPSPHLHARRWLSPGEAHSFLGGVRELTGSLLQSIAKLEDCQFDQPLPPAVLQILDRANQYYPGLYQSDILNYQCVYHPIGILPPDQYNSVVLQMTEGCSYNTCTFCSFYRDRPFKIKSPDEFLSHIKSVVEFLGDGFSLRRTIFLGDANALVVPMPRLIPLLNKVHEHLPVEALGGIYAFQDGFSAERKSSQDYQQLSRLGIKRIYIGLESGCDSLLRFLNKPGTVSDAIEAVRTIKDGGIHVGVIILVGAGGHQFAKSHVSETIKSINAMNLDLDDLIYFSELVESEGMDYVKNAFKSNLNPLSPLEIEAQTSQMEAGFRFSGSGGSPHISRYDIREFVY